MEDFSTIFPKLWQPGDPMPTCACGCLQEVSLASQTNTRRGWRVGQPLKFVRGHGNRQPRTWHPGDPMPYCSCGCNKEVSLSKVTNKNLGLVAGQPNRFIHGHKIATETWTEVDRGFEPPCYIWDSHIDARGYGRMSNGELAHRVIYVRSGRELIPGLHLHHRCGQTDCVRPEHCEQKTAGDHARLHKTKMTADKARQIREMEGSQRSIAQHFGISQGLVWQIKHGLVWNSDS